MCHRLLNKNALFHRKRATHGTSTCLQRFLQARSWFETNCLAGFDANLSACAWVATLASCSFLHRERAETRIGEAAIFFDGSPHNTKDAVNELAGRFLGEIHLFAGFDDLIDKLSISYVSSLPYRARRELIRRSCGNHYRIYVQ